MRSVVSIGGKVKKTPSNLVDADRYNFLKLSDAEPDFGIPPANEALISSDTSGNRSWLNFGDGLKVESGEIVVDETTVPIDTSAFNFSSSNVLADVLADFDQNISNAVAGNLDSVSTDVTLSGNGTSSSPLSVVGGNADTLENENGAYYLNYNNFANTPTIGDGTLTVSGGSGLTGTGTFDANQTTNNTITLNHADTSSVSNLTSSSRTYVDGLSFDAFGHVTGFTTSAETVTNTDTFVDSVSFNTSDGILTIGRNDAANVTTDLDGRYLLQGAKAADADLLDGQNGTHYLDYSNFTNTPTIGDGTLTVSGGSGLTGSGTFDANATTNNTVTLNHADTSSQGSVNGSGNTFIQDVTLDGFGHVTGLGTATVVIPDTANDATITINAGGGLTTGGSFTTDQATNETITIDHANTSSQGDVNNSGGTVIQDINVDTYGHITSIGSKSLSASDVGALSTSGKAADSNLLDGINSSQFLRSDTNDTLNGDVTVTGNVILNSGSSWIGLSNSQSDPNIEFEGGGIEITGGPVLIGSGSPSGNEGDLTVNGDLSVSGTVDGRDIASDGSKLDGIEPGATATQPNDASITINAGNDLSGGGTFTTDQSSNETITIDHGNTSGLSGTYGSTSNATKIDNITVDANGHVTGITTGATGDIAAVTAGSGLTGGGSSGSVTLNHADTSSQGSVNNSGDTVIQGITLDGFGHITGISSTTVGGGGGGGGASSIDDLSDAKATGSSLALGNLAAPNSNGGLNVSVGVECAEDLAGGYGNTYIGHSNSQDAAAGIWNTSVGSSSASEGMASTAIGRFCNTNNYFNSTVLGFGAFSGADNEITLGNGSIDTLICAATTITAPSDRRDKRDITPVKAGLDFVNKLQPVDFVWDKRDGSRKGQKDIGFIGQDLKQVQEDTGITIPNLVREVEEDKIQASYGTLLPVMVQAIKDLSYKVEILETRLKELEGE